MSADTLKAETELIVKLLREAGRDKWEVSASLDDVPAETGHYALDDGLRGLGGGISRNMRTSLRAMASGKDLKRPIYRWLPDADGSAAKWLDEIER